MAATSPRPDDANTSLDHHVTKVVAQAGELTPAHVGRLRSLLGFDRPCGCHREEVAEDGSGA